MITEHDLQEAIAECEGQRNPTSSTCMKLAAFYTIKDKMYPSSQSGEPALYSEAMGPVKSDNADYSNDTEFSRLIDGVEPAILIPIMDELMSTLSVVCPRLYAGVLRKLSNL